MPKRNLVKQSECAVFNFEIRQTMDLGALCLRCTRTKEPWEPRAIVLHAYVADLGEELS